MRRRAVVHVGWPRTGTTALQAVLHDLQARGRLATVGAFYPEAVLPGYETRVLNHQHLGEALDGRRGGADRRTLFGMLSDRLRRTEADTVILSYEGLCRIVGQRRFASDIAAFLEQHGFAMEVLLTVRPQEEAINSLYTLRAQYLREPRRFAEAFSGDLAFPPFRLDALLGAWAPVARAGVIAVPVRDAQQDGNLIARVFAAMSLGSLVPEALGSHHLDPFANRSPGPLTVEVSRRVRRAGQHLLIPTSERRLAIHAVEQHLAERGLDGKPFSGLDEALRKEAREQFAAGNDAFARAVWGCPWEDRVATGLASASNELAGSALPAGTEDVLTAAVATIRPRLAGRATSWSRRGGSEALDRIGEGLRTLRALGSRVPRHPGPARRPPRRQRAVR